MGRKIFWALAIAAGALLFWRFGYQASLRYFFKVSGTVKMRASDVPPLPVNTMLFVVAKNESGVPVAVKKIINPVFPLNFEMTPSNLIMPDLLTRRVYLEAFLNMHGRLGVFGKNDFKGEYGAPVAVRSKGIGIQLETPEK